MFKFQSHEPTDEGRRVKVFAACEIAPSRCIPGTLRQIVYGCIVKQHLHEIQASCLETHERSRLEVAPRDVHAAFSCMSDSATTCLRIKRAAPDSALLRCNTEAVRQRPARCFLS